MKIEKLGGIAALEYKYDGLRIQIHKRGNEIRPFLPTSSFAHV